MSNRCLTSTLIAAIAGTACAWSSAALAADRSSPPTTEVTNPEAGFAQRVVQSGALDDSAELELARKLGVPQIARGGLRGLPVCPDITFDVNSCHPVELDLAANFSNTGATNFRVAESVVPASQNPTRICWVGRYEGRVAPVVADESFVVTIWNNDGGFPNLAAGPIFQREFRQSGAAGNNLLELDCLDGQSCPGTTTPAAGGNYIYSAEVAGGFPMNANGCYWIEIACSGSAGAGTRWGWAASLSGTDNTSIQAINGAYTLFTRVTNDRAICITGGTNQFFGGCQIAPSPPVCTNPAANGFGFDGVGTNPGLFASWPGSAAAAGSGWGVFQGAENFAFGAQTTVTNICFEGFWQGYQNGTPVAVAVPADPAFRVTYFSNNGTGGVPGAPLPMAEFQLGQPGVTLQWDNDGDISITHPPVQFAANTCYWVSIGRVQVQASAATPVPIFHWLLTTSSTPGADDRIALRTAGAAPGAWQAQPNIAPPSNNLNFLLSGGPLVQQSCNTAPPCNITIPGGVIQENEPNCGGGVAGGDTTNGGCNSATYVTSPIQCGQTVRGTTAWNGTIRDTDWYTFTINQSRDVTITANAEFAGTLGFIGNAAGPINGPVNCQAPDLQLNPAVAVGGCTPVSLTRTLAAGTYTVFVGGPLGGDQILCGSNVGSEYLLTVTCSEPSPPPSNDLCANAIALNTPCAGQDVTVSGTTNNATNDNQAACGTAVAQTAGGVWYTVVGNGSPITATLCTGTTYDSQISVYSGACGATVCVAGDDDGCGPIGGPSSVTWSSVNGTTYRILVHGWALETGAFSMTLSSTATCGGGTDCNGNGIPDSQEIAANPALDCYNPTVVQNPHVMGGADGIIDACQCAANWNRDAQVNSTDLSTFITSWLAAVNGQTTGADINCSGTVNSTDLSAFITLWLSALNNTVPFDGCP